MGQIVKRKKKGRPSKADLAHRAATEASERDLRRSLRRRSVRYNFDFDEYIDDEEEDVVDDDDDDDEEIGREKKLKLVLKLQNNKESGAESDPSRTRRVDHAPTPTGSAASSSGSEDGHMPPKKRKIDGDDEIEGDLDDEIDDADDEVREPKTDAKEAGSVPGTPPEPTQGWPLPDKKSLELMLDKLQKKDTYGVYAEPVDPEELPDYHDVIEHPMDFATVRKKLANGSYSTLEQFENDIFLICTNAMQYNAPDTVYHKQARSIQELAIRKFQRIKIDIERSNKELKSEQNPISDSLGKSPIKKPMIKTLQEPVGSDFSSGATLATTGDFQHGSNAIQAGGCERPANVDGIVERNSSLIDNSLDKAEDLLSGKGLFSKFGRKPLVNEENRRATYNISNNPPVGSESILSTFDSEIKQLVSVGLHADHSYARSLARFAATLGPVAWKVASQRIEQVLPAESKFGRGWVGEYEPLPTPVLMLENGTRKELTSLGKLNSTSDARKDDITSKILVTAKEQSISGPTSEGTSSLLGPNGSKPTVTLSTSTPVPSVRGANLDGKPSFLCSTGATRPYHQQNPQSRNPEPERKVVLKQVELNSPPSSAYQKAAGFLAEKQVLNGSEVPASRSVETISRNGNVLHSVPFKQLDSSEVVSGALPNGKVVTSDRNKMVSSSTHNSVVPNQMVRAANYFPHGQEQGLSDPVQLMRMLADNAQKQQKSSNHSSVENPSIPSSRVDDSSNAATAAARAWMSIGAGGFKPGVENTNKNHISADSLYNSTRELHPQVSRFRGEFPVSGVHFQHEKNGSPVQAFVGSPVRLGNQAQLQNRPMVFPQLVTADLSRFHMQSPWRGLNPQTQLRQKQESLPPDLNIGFPSAGSPGRQSSGVLVDSQQPDLALQL